MTPSLLHGYSFDNINYFFKIILPQRYVLQQRIVKRNFAVSVNGSSAGYTFCNNTPCLSPGLRARSVFRCEASSRKKGHNSPCYVYAVKRKIVWENYKTAKTPVRHENEQKPITAGKILKRDKAKKDCEELGFQPKTPGFGKCVLQLIQ